MKHSTKIYLAGVYGVLAAAAVNAGDGINGNPGQTLQCEQPVGEEVIIIPQNVPASALPGGRYCYAEYGVNIDAFALSSGLYFDKFNVPCTISISGENLCVDRFLSPFNERSDIAARLRTHVINSIAPGAPAGGWYDQPDGQGNYPAFTGLVVIDIEGEVNPKTLGTLIANLTAAGHTTLAQDIYARFGDAVAATHDVFPNAEIAFDALVSGPNPATAPSRAATLIAMFNSGVPGLKLIDTLIVNVYFRIDYSYPSAAVATASNGMQAGETVADAFKLTYNKCLNLLPMMSWRNLDHGPYLLAFDPDLSTTMGPMVSELYDQGAERISIWGPGLGDTETELEQDRPAGVELGGYFLELLQYFWANPTSTAGNPIPYVRVPGDLDGDDCLSPSEETALGLAILNALPTVSEPDPPYQPCLDLNDDGQVDATDWLSVYSPTVFPRCPLGSP